MRVVHLLDDFAMGGVTKGLSIFAEPELAALATHDTLPVAGRPLLAPRIAADVIVTHLPPAWNRLAYFRSLKIRNPQARWIHVEHSYTAAWEARYVPSRKRFRTLLRSALADADEVICVSRAQGAWLGGILGRTPRCVHPWSGRASLLGMAPLPPRDPRAPVRLACFGRFSAQKNVPALIAAAARLPHGVVELHIAGEGPDEAALHRAAETVPAIVMHGRIDDLATFLAPMEGVIVPSIYEAFGQVALEARLAARPILVADLDGLPEQVGRGGLSADCSTPEAIAAAIRRFVTLPLAEMGRAGREDARGHRDQVVAAWHEVLTAPRASGRPGKSVVRELAMADAL